MPANIPPLSFTITGTIRDVAQNDWEELLGKGLIEGYGYQKTIEESGMKEFTLGYLVGKRADRTVMILPFFIMDFSFHTLTRGILQKLALKFKSLSGMRVLFFGTPTAEEFYFGYCRDEDLDNLLGEAMKAVSRFCKEEKIAAVLFNNLSQKNDALAGRLKKKGFIRLQSLPTTVIKVNASTLENYINSLSQNMRKDLRRKLNRSGQKASLTTVIRDDIEGIEEAVYGLYLNNFDDSGVHFEMLTREFFSNICREMPGVAKYFITYDKDRIVAFNLCLIKDDTFIDKFIGFDTAVAHEYHLYFTTFCHNMDFCIRNGLRFYQPGTTDYHPKVRLGAELIPLDIWAKAYNPLLNFSVRLIRRLIEPKNLDPSLKSIEKIKRKN